MVTLGITHTTLATVNLLKNVIEEVFPSCQTINIVDDSILPQLTRNNGDIKEVEKRWVQYAKNLKELGVDCILNACSSVGELVFPTRKAVDIPVFRIDDVMAEKAVSVGERIGIVATLSTTLQPTTRLIKSKELEKNKNVSIQPVLVNEAYQELIKGNQEGHDKLLADKLMELEKEVDIVVLAQASMSSVVMTLPPNIQHKFLSSPYLAINLIKEKMGGE